MQHSKEWHEERRKGIGGSDAATVLGKSKYGCLRRLWYDKSDVPADYPEAYSLDIERGVRLEPVIADMFAEQQDKVLAVRDRGIYLNGHEHIRCNPDRIIHGGEDVGVLEIKARCNEVFRMIATEGVSKADYIQLQHNMLVCDLPYGALAILNCNSFELYVEYFQANEELREMMVEEYHKFWATVGRLRSIPERCDMELGKCSGCCWRVTCLGDAFIKPVAKFKEKDRVDLTEDMNLVDLVAAYIRLLPHYESACEEHDAVKAKIKKHLLGADVLKGFCCRDKLTISKQTRNTLSAARIREDHPEIAKDYTEKSFSVSLRITPIKGK